ncbi:helix-turn-helix domain-containing protein [Mucilaginibacter robiniae]|uniref:helix-turn-helix domain-containing protein n=1 Tax=Mucilaginibacter robiniae TaxID=2728022 RepID=UPI001B7D1F44|nr:helix-turn-helix transcriptional regulator [Mucilaginibacter robiniae]
MPVSYPANPGTIGEHLKKKRIDSKLLQKDVAKILGVTEDCITNWEKNRSIPQIQFFPNIIQFLGYLPYSFDLTTLSGKLKAYRHVKGISQKKLGTMLNVDGATICSWEQGESQPYQRTLQKINTLFKKFSGASFSMDRSNLVIYFAILGALTRRFRRRRISGLC